jgi:hypothetical protein
MAAARLRRVVQREGRNTTMLSPKICLAGTGLVLLSAFSSGALAAGAGQIQHLSGTLSVQRADGSIRILSQKSEVNPGEVLTTQKDSYAQINFTDGSSMTMRPNTQMKLVSYQFIQDKPQEDSAFFSLIKGGLRTVTGLVGKRGNQDAYRIGTSTATIGIRGSAGETLDCTQGCDGVVPGGDKAEKAVYHNTLTGSYIMTSADGTVVIGEGQFALHKVGQAPQILKDDPGFKLNELPFIIGQNLNKSNAENCVVR